MKRAMTTLRLRAGWAAHAFARRRMLRRVMRRWMPWISPALRWRRAAAVAVAVAERVPEMLRSPQPLVTSSWQLHMHFRVYGSAPPRRSATRSHPHAEPKSAVHVVRARMRRLPQRSEQQWRATTVLLWMARGNPRMESVRPGMRHAAAIASLRPYATRSLPVATRQGHLHPSTAPVAAMARSVEWRVPAASRVATAPASPRPHPSQARTPQTWRVTAASVPSLLELLAKRSPDLVWRARKSIPEGHVDATPSQAIEAGSGSRPNEARESKADRHPAAAAQTALITHPIDSTFVDRLADDVIRRIDRRVRIERERKGL